MPARPQLMQVTQMLSKRSVLTRLMWPMWWPPMPQQRQQWMLLQRQFSLPKFAVVVALGLELVFALVLELEPASGGLGTAFDFVLVQFHLFVPSMAVVAA